MSTTTRSTKQVQRVRFSPLDEDGLRHVGELYVYVDGTRVATIQRTGTRGYWGAYTVWGRPIFRGHFTNQREAREHVLGVAYGWNAAKEDVAKWREAQVQP